MSDPLKEYRSIRLSRRGREYEPAEVAVEATIPLYLNDRRIAVLTATPQQLRELGAGYVVSEGLATPDQITNITIDRGEVYVSAESPDLELWHELRSSGCIGVSWEEQEEVTVNSNTIFNPRVIWDSLDHLDSHVYRVSRGAHSATIITIDGEAIARAVDIGRHCAVDKAIGTAVLEECDLSNCFILSSGRQSRGMVLKAARAGIPLVVSKAAPLSSGVDAAESARLTLVCYADREKIRVFTHPGRIRGAQP